MATIIGVSGRLRRASYNAALLRIATELALAIGAIIDIGSIRDVPQRTRARLRAYFEGFARFVTAD
jgi:NAD(P)H-dependent FMN reductase